MHPLLPLFVTIVLLHLSISGCEQSGQAPSLASPEERRRVMEEIAQAERRAQNTKAPEPNIVLATPPGWAKTETRPLPPEDNGFTVGYEHQSGLAVTLYQFTRGLTAIQSDVTSSIVKDEMNRAREGIEQAVQLGYWKAAKLVESKTVRLGDSQQQALWARYHLTVDGAILTSDIYVWARSNTLFKIRCTSRSEDVAPNQSILEPLLTAFGSPVVPTDQQTE